MLLIKNGHIIDAKSKRDEIADILINDGKIIAIEKQMELSEEIKQVQIIDAKEKKVIPGLVDVHVHFRDPGFVYKEDIQTGAKAAAKGGFTTVVLMANTKPTVDNIETLHYVLDEGKKTKIHVHTCAAVTKGLQGMELTDMNVLYKEGAVGFTDDGIPILDEKVLRQAMIETAKLNVPISLHEENPAFIENNGVNAGVASAHFGIGGSKREAEISMIERDIEMALETGAVLNVQHISTKEGVELVRQGKKRGSNIHAEATPHHFTLTEEALIKHGTLAKMNPPLRTQDDLDAIIKGLMDGTIDMIATDHAPHSKEEKDKAITEAPSGIVGLETALPLAVTNLVKKRHLTLTQLVEKMSFNPANLYGLDAGYLAVGGPADLVILDDNEMHTVEGFLSKSANSPFIGEKLYGTIYYTIAGGEIAYEKED